MREYPKRLYKNGKGTTVSSEDEEREFLGVTAPVEVPDPAPVEEEEQEEEIAHTDKEALEYIVSKGYSKKAAKSILKKEGLEAIMAAKAEGRDPQE